MDPQSPKTWLIEQLEFGWDFFFWQRMKGLSDEEFLWEPFTGCWSLRMGAGGKVQADWQYPAPQPIPFTTLAWQVAHMTWALADRYEKHFGSGQPCAFDQLELSLQATKALDLLLQRYENWRAALRAMPEERLHQPTGPAEGPYAAAPFATLVLHISREVFHHSAHCARLRDLYLYREKLTGQQR